MRLCIDIAGHHVLWGHIVLCCVLTVLTVLTLPPLYSCLQWDQFEVRNKTRVAEKNQNHAQFVAHAVEDMAQKREQQGEELQRELEGSAFLIRRAQAAQGGLMCPLLHALMY